MQNEYVEMYKYSAIEDGNDSGDQYLLTDGEGTVINDCHIQYVTRLPKVQMSADTLAEDNNQSSNHNVFDAASFQYELVDTSGNELALQRRNVEFEHEFLLDGSASYQVMLSQEQSRLFEEKGRVLLDVENKYFLLDSFGLHDITYNYDTIEQLREELTNESAFEPLSSIDERGLSLDTAVNQSILLDSQDASQTNTETELSTVIDDQIHDDVHLDKNKTISIGIVSKQPAKFSYKRQPSSVKILKKRKNNSSEQVHNVNVTTNSEYHTIDNSKDESSVIKLKVNFNADDIPKRIFIGYNSKGNKIFAKVTDIKRNATNSNQTNPITSRTNESQSVPSEILNYLDSGLWRASTCHDDVARASRVVHALLRRRDACPLLAGERLLVTRMNVKNAGSHRETRTVGAFVEGEVVKSTADGGDKWTFVLCKSPGLGKQTPEYSVTHVHVTENIECNKESPTTVVIRRTKLRRNQVNKIEPIHLCSACGQTYSTEQQLLHHQQTHNSTQIGDSEFSSSSTSDFNQTTQYKCNYCKKIFYRPLNLYHHITSKCSANMSKSNKRENQKADICRDVHKCNMCTSSFNYSSTLLRHILSVHLSGNNNKI